MIRVEREQMKIGLVFQSMPNERLHRLLISAFRGDAESHFPAGQIEWRLRVVRWRSGIALSAFWRVRVEHGKSYFCWAKSAACCACCDSSSATRARNFSRLDCSKTSFSCRASSFAITALSGPRSVSEGVGGSIATTLRYLGKCLLYQKKQKNGFLDLAGSLARSPQCARCARAAAAGF